MLIDFFSYSVLLPISTVCVVVVVVVVVVFRLWDRKLSLVLVHLPRFKINLEVQLLFLVFSQCICLKTVNANVTLWLITLPDGDPMCCVASCQIRNNDYDSRNRKWIYFVIPKAFHTETHHLQGQSLLNVSPFPLNEVTRIFWVEGEASFWVTNYETLLQLKELKQSQTSIIRSSVS